MNGPELAGAKPAELAAAARDAGGRSKFLGIFGGTSSGLGAFGAAHSVCHYTCQAIIALLALAGISVAGMPLGFLLDPRLIVLFSAIGLVSAALGAAFQWRMHMRFDRRLAVFAALAVVSAISLTSGVLDLGATGGMPQDAAAAPSFTVDAAAKTDSPGDVTIEIAYRAADVHTLVFRVAMDSMKMDAPPLAKYDLARLARLAGIGAAEIRPSRWSVEETGHMGHHVKGTLAFKLEPAQRALLELGPASFDIVIADVGSAKKRVFSWKTAPGGK